MVLFVTAGMADAQVRSGGTSIVVYSKENGIAPGWRDHSWGDETEVEAWSGAPIEASVGSWGALALASVVGEGEEERSNAVQASDGAEVVIVFQGPEGSSEGGANDWLYLTDGRAVPKLTSRQHVKSLRRPLDLGRVRVYLEDSESGRSSRDFLLSGLSSPPAVKADDSEFLEASFLVAPALESSGMDKFDKIVLKDAKGSGFALRVARVEIRPSDAAAETPREVAEVYSKTEGGSPAISIRSWLPGDANVDDADVEGGPEAVALRSLENFKSRPRCEEYGAPVERSRISDASLKEPSGFAASRRYEGILWTHQDRDTDPYLYAVIASTGEVVSKIYVDTKKYGETDWEDIAVALCPDGSGDHCVWIADSGNVARDRETFYVHVMKEPTLERWGKIEAHQVWTFPYQFPQGFHASEGDQRPWVDVESMMVSPDGSRLWLMEKTVNSNGRGPVTVWQTPVGSGPKDLVSRDNDNILRDVTRRGRDAARENPSFVIQVELANKIHNPTVREHAASLRADAFDPPLSGWARDKYQNELSSFNWNKLRAITGADLHPSGRSFVACTYSGIWEYPLPKPYDLTEIGRPKLLSLTAKLDDAYWQTEAVAYGANGKEIFLASEYYKGHQPIRHFGCRSELEGSLE